MPSAVFGGMRHVPLAVAASALALLPARPALACGGFFCSSSPINQSKEIIVYGLEDDGTVTMSVQVQYQGRDEDFAWILPLPAPPAEIGVGDDALFQALSEATSPIFSLEERVEGTCRASPMCTYPSYGGGCGLGCASYAAAPRVFADAGGAVQADAGVRVYSEATIGPYDTVVLGASAAASVIEWLQTNGYDVPASSESLLEPYAAQGHVFVALRLTANRLSSVLRPITVRMPTTEACLPIRLTPIATTPTLPIEAYFLGRAQVRSSNYSTAEIELAPNLWRGTLTYDQAVRQRVQALGGRAFATDYAGAVPEIAITIQSVLDLQTETDPARFLQGLRARGLSGTRLLSDLFDAYLTPPSGDDTVSYLNCLSSGSTSSCGTPIRFDATGLARAIEDAIIIPRAEAQALVDRHGYLTRLSTTIAAQDMTVDPVFVEDAGLQDVPRVRLATLITHCADAYFVEHAPQSLVAGAVAHVYRDGAVIEPSRFCAVRGATLSEPSSGCSSSRTPLPVPRALLIALAFVGAFALRRLRKR